MSAATPVGIEAINVYCGLARTSVREMMEGRGLDTARQIEQDLAGVPGA